MLFIFLTLLVFCSNINSIIHSIILPKTISLQPRICSMQYTIYDEYDKSDKYIKLLSKEKTNNLITK